MVRGAALLHAEKFESKLAPSPSPPAVDLICREPLSSHTARSERSSGKVP